MQELEVLKQDVVKRLNGLTPSNLEEVLRLFKLEAHEKGSFILSQGDISKHIYFIVSGDLQVIYQDSSGRSWTRDFLTNGDWCCSLHSFFNHQACEEEVMSLSPSILLAIHKSDFDYCAQHFPDFIRVYQQIITDLNITSINRLQHLLSCNASARIEWLHTNKKHYLGKYSSKALASYLHLHKDVYSRLSAVRLKSNVSKK